MLGVFAKSGLGGGYLFVGLLYGKVHKGGCQPYDNYPDGGRLEHICNGGN